MFIIENVFALSLQHTAYTDAAWLWIHSWKRGGTGRWSERKLVRSRTLVWEFWSFIGLWELFSLAWVSWQNAWVIDFPPFKLFPHRHTYDSISYNSIWTFTTRSYMQQMCLISSWLKSDFKMIFFFPSPDSINSYFMGPSTVNSPDVFWFNCALCSWREGWRDGWIDGWRIDRCTNGRWAETKK